ncbi:MAG: threonine synthase [Planctomycetota bacterium]|nr:MAG: threonine synthase [Planctomycetota bacterium]
MGTGGAARPPARARHQRVDWVGVFGERPGEQPPLEPSRLLCPVCRNPGPDRPPYACPACGELLELVHPAPPVRGAALRARLAARPPARHDPRTTSGVWRFSELIAPGLEPAAAVSQREGNTPLYESRALAAFAGLARPLLLKHEGMNPTGSFKDRGMTVGVSRAVALGARAVACASTGNTAASLAAYAALGGLRALVLVPAGGVAPGKLAQALAYGARCIEVEGSFDTALALLERAAAELPLYVLNSVNPWRIEGQKTIVLEALAELDWQPPDAIALPAGNLGNTSAFGKALAEAQALGLIERLPRLLPVQAEGAAPFHRMLERGAAELEPEPEPRTVASAIRIGRPRSWRRAARAVRRTGGRSAAVSDAEILEAKAAIDAAGLGCEPASAAALAGLRRLVAAGAVPASARVLCVLTGHLLKDPATTLDYHAGPEPGPRANRPVRVPAEPAALLALVERELERG